MQVNPLIKSRESQIKLVSALYRITLILYTSLLLILKDFDFSLWATFGYFSLYVILFIILYGKDSIYSFLRLLNDYVFIGLTVFSIGLIDVYTLGLLFIPILNSQNHTGKKKSILLYVYPIIIILLVQKKFDIFLFMPFLFFLTINSFELVKNRYQRFYDELNSSLDSFLIEENSMEKLHNIYDVIIPIFNNYMLFDKRLETIICFERKGSNFDIVNGSRFIINFYFGDKKDLLNDSKKIIYNIKGIIINDENVNKSIAIKIEKNNINYIYLLIPEIGNGANMINRAFFYELLSPFLFRLSHVFNFKKVQNVDYRKNLNSLGKKVTYVNNAIGSMHFTRNKLGPLKTYLAMSDDYEKESSPERKKMIEPFLKDERKRLKSSLDEILKRANFILEKSNNPFNVLDSEKVSFFNILVKVRELAGFFLKNEEFHFVFDDINSLGKYKVEVNEDGIEMVFSNWLSNVNKYKSEDKYGVIISETESHYILKFFNKFTWRTGDPVPDFIEDFNSKDRMAILKRQTHGLIEIKDFLEQMALESNMSIEKDMVYFEIKFLKF